VKGIRKNAVIEVGFFKSSTRNEGKFMPQI